MEARQLLADVATELIKLIPTLLWVLIAAWIVYLLKDPIRTQILPRLTGLKLPGGIELSLADKELERAAKDTEREAREQIEEATRGLRGIEPDDYIVTPEQRSQVLRRVQAVLPALQPGAQILWVDDHPENNTNERRMLQALRIFVDEALSTDQALARLARARYDVVISDMARNGNNEAGNELLKEMRSPSRRIDTPVILYVGYMDASKALPTGAFGMCVRPDELLHYILDVLERRRL